MLRSLSWLFFAVAVCEVVLTLAHKLDLGAGLVAICFALFFGGVFHGLSAIELDVRALREHFLPTERGADAK
jgi:hypothetical protein